MTTERPVIVLVDDDEAMRRTWPRILGSEPLTLHVSKSGREVLHILDATAVDVIVADYNMPDMDGVQLLETVRHQAPEIGRVLMTGHIFPDVFVEAVNRAGVHHILLKPLKPQQFRADLQRIIEECAQYQSAIKDSDVARPLSQLRAMYLELSEIAHRLRTQLIDLRADTEAPLKAPTKTLLDYQTALDDVQHKLDATSRMWNTLAKSRAAN